MAPPSKAKKKSRPSGVTVTRTRSGGYNLRAYGPAAPDLRTVIPKMFAPRKDSPAVEEECRTCLGVCRIRDGETKELRRCLDCGGTGLAP